jgi:tRNA dimethylallyltransferase
MASFFLQELLRNLDIETYEKMDINNTQRVIRALEVCLGTGKKFSSFKDKNKTKEISFP